MTNDLPSRATARQAAAAPAANSIALCHDWLTGMRGGERVLEVLCDAYPDAPIYTLLANRTSISQTINNHHIRTSFLQHIPGIYRNYRYLLPLLPAAIRTLGPVTDNVLLSTSHCVAKSIPVINNCRHVCYCFTPMRYAWTFHDEYFGKNRLKSALLSPLLAWLRRWDRQTAKSVTRFVAISRHIQNRIQRFYGRESDVVYPPVATSRFSVAKQPAADFDLIVSALVPYKRIDLAVRAYSRAGRKLVVVGNGSCLPTLSAMAADCVSFRQGLPDDEVARLYQSCRMLIFPGEEDFGIVPVEAQACGRPVVAYRKGGATETVIEHETGLFFDSQSETALMEAVSRADAIAWDPQAIRRNALQFDTSVFAARIKAIVTEEMILSQQPS